MKFNSIVLFCLIGTIFLGVCTSKSRITETGIPIMFDDTVTLNPGQKDWLHSVVDKSRGRVTVKITNYQDTTATFRIFIEEMVKE